MTSDRTISHGKIGVLVKTYPKISETFILEELLGLERKGLRLHIFSLRRGTDEVRHAAGDAVRAPISYVRAGGLSSEFAAIRAHLRFFWGNPRRYLRTLQFALRCEESGRVAAFFQAGYLAKQLEAARVRHLHAHFASEPAGVAELVAKLSGISFSISAHAKDIYLSSPTALRRKIDGARFIVTCTEYNRKYLARIATREERVLRMYHGIDLDRFQRGSVPTSIDATPLILSVGRLREKKGFATLIEAVRLLRDAGARVRCQIVGYGEDHAALAHLARRLGVQDDVRLAGKMTHEQLLDVYRTATVFALPCQVASDGDRDGIPNVLLEAMAVELAVVSTDISGIPEVIRDGTNGLLVQPGDPVGLAAAIRRLVDDPALRMRLGAAGRRTVASMFCADRNLEIVAQLLLAASHPASHESDPGPLVR